MVTISAANFRVLHCGIFSSGKTSSVRFTPSGVISNAQARTSAMGKPSNTIAMTNLVTQFGMSSTGKVDVAIWMTSQPTTA